MRLYKTPIDRKTAFKDSQYETIYLGDTLVKIDDGQRYGVMFDYFLRESVINLETKEKEKMNSELMKSFVIKGRIEESL